MDENTARYVNKVIPKRLLSNFAYYTVECFLLGTGKSPHFVPLQAFCLSQKFGSQKRKEKMDHRDIEMIMQQTGCNYDLVLRAMDATDNNAMSTIMALLTK